MLMNAMKIGERAVIEGFADDDFSLKLLEMGCIPGEVVTLERIAPLGDPIVIEISGYRLSMRKEEAAAIRVRLVG